MRDAVIEHAKRCREALRRRDTRPTWAGGSLTGANLRWANLTGANLTGANLRGANLRGANLRWADLTGADLTGADLTGADLTGASLRGANLTGASLRGANLTGANLRGANLSGANLTGTCLDPANTPRMPTVDQMESARLTPKRVKGRERIYGWRTRYSQHAGTHKYTPNRFHHANALSTCPDTECHPGIYFGGTAYAQEVQVWAYADECHWVSAEKGVRARRVWVT